MISPAGWAEPARMTPNHVETGLIGHSDGFGRDVFLSCVNDPVSDGICRAHELASAGSDLSMAPMADYAYYLCGQWQNKGHVCNKNTDSISLLVQC